MSASRQFPKSHLEGWWAKIIPLIALLITTTIITTLLYLNIIQWTFTDTSWMIESGSKSGVFQTIANIFSALQIFAMLSLVNFATRLALCRSKSTLDVLKYRAAICLGRIDLTLPYFSMVLVLFIYAIMKGPAFLWANSIAFLPRVTSASHNLSLPILGTDDFIHNYNGDELKYCWKSPANFSIGPYMTGPYTSCPGQGYIDSLLQATSTVSAGSSTRARVDMNGAYYLDRSYGLAAAAALSDFQQIEDWMNGAMDNYTYQDLGFNTTILCEYVTLSTPTDWSFHEIQPGNLSIGIPTIFEARGYLPGSSSEAFYSTWGWSDGGIVAWQTTNSTHNPNYISIAAGSDYLFMNNTQCNITFTPTVFDILVSYPSAWNPKLYISVTPNETAPENAVDPSWHLRTLVLEQITAMSMTSTTLYGSVLGEAFLANALSCSSNVTNTAKLNDGTLLPCIQKSWESIIDNLLLLFTAAQIEKYVKENQLQANPQEILWDPDQFRQVAAQQNWTAWQIGSRTYLILTFLLNSICLTIWVIEACRWSFWKDLPAFNIMDLKSAILGAAAGGSDIVSTLEEVESLTAPWTGASGDQNVGKIQVQVHPVEGTGASKTIILKATLASEESGEIGRAPWYPFFYKQTSSQRELEMRLL